MSSISGVTDRSTLLSEARSEWLQRAQTKAGQKSAKVPQAPSNSELIAEDAQLAKQVAKAEAAAEAATTAATKAVTQASVNLLG